MNVLFISQDPILKRRIYLFTYVPPQKDKLWSSELNLNPNFFLLRNTTPMTHDNIFAKDVICTRQHSWLLTVTKTPTLSSPGCRHQSSVPHLKSQLCSTWNDTVCNKTLNLITFLLHLSYDEYIYMMKLGSTEKLSLCKFFCLSVNNH